MYPRNVWRSGFVGLLFGVSLLGAAGCGTGDARPVPDVVAKSKKEDVEKARYDADAKAKLDAKAKRGTKGH